MSCRVRDAIKDKVSVVDVDGSYLFRKHEQAGINVAPFRTSITTFQWPINEAKIPRVLPGTHTLIPSPHISHTIRW